MSTEGYPYQTSGFCQSVQTKHGSASFTKISSQYSTETSINMELKNLMDPQVRQHSAELERKLFKKVRKLKQMDSEPREVIRSYFCDFNTPEMHGPISPPPKRVTANPEYQYNLRLEGVAV